MEGWQRDFPLRARPFASIAARLGCDEGTVLQRLERLVASGAVSRVGATVRPNSVGASTLAALAAPAGRIDEIGGRVAAEPGVNHCYARENPWNLWFVVTGPDRHHVTAALRRIVRASGLTVLNLPLRRAYHVDLGFALTGACVKQHRKDDLDMSALQPGDDAILQGLTTGLALVSRPWRTLARAHRRSEAQVIARVRALAAAGIVTRLGLILRHRALGWSANAMVVWRVPPAARDRAGAALAAAPGVTLAYARRPDARRWPFNLYAMVHGKSREETLDIIAAATREAGLGLAPRQVLFSTRCYAQRGALLRRVGEAA